MSNEPLETHFRNHCSDSVSHRAVVPGMRVVGFRTFDADGVPTDHAVREDGVLEPPVEMKAWQTGVVFVVPD